MRTRSGRLSVSKKFTLQVKDLRVGMVLVGAPGGASAIVRLTQVREGHVLIRFANGNKISKKLDSSMDVRGNHESDRT